MIEPGLYRHYKSTDAAPKLYRVLFVAELGGERGLNPDDSLLIVADAVAADCGIVALSDTTPEDVVEGTVLFYAKWSGNKDDGDDQVVIYVALYDDGRVAARPLKEFEDHVDVMGGASRRRFERIGE